MVVVLRVMSWMEASVNHAVALSMVCSKSLAKRRLRFSYAKVRSTTQRSGKTSKHFCPVGTLDDLDLPRSDFGVSLA
jgi:hypothetical protein